MDLSFAYTMVIIEDLTVDAILGFDFLEAIREKLLKIPSFESPIPISDHLHCS